MRDGDEKLKEYCQNTITDEVTKVFKISFGEFEGKDDVRDCNEIVCVLMSCVKKFLSLKIF